MISDFPGGLSDVSFASGVIMDSDVSKIADSGLSDVAEDSDEMEDADEVIGLIPPAADVQGGFGCGSCKFNVIDYFRDMSFPVLLAVPIPVWQVS